MSPFCVVLAVLTVAFAAGCITLRRKNKAFEGMLCKFMASFGFISVAVVGYSTNPVDTYYFCLVCYIVYAHCGDDILCCSCGDNDAYLSSFRCSEQTA